MDVFLGKKTPFHLTAGVYAGAGRFIHWEADWQFQTEEEDRANRSFTYRGFTFSTDENGVVKADARMKHWVPYVGLGYGRAVDPDKHLSISADLGVLITGGIQVQTYDFVGNPDGTPVILTSSNLVTPGGRQLDRGWTDRAARWPVLPMLRINVFFHLF